MHSALSGASIPHQYQDLLPQQYFTCICSNVCTSAVVSMNFLPCLCLHEKLAACATAVCMCSPHPQHAAVNIPCPRPHLPVHPHTHKPGQVDTATPAAALACLGTTSRPSKSSQQMGLTAGSSAAHQTSMSASCSTLCWAAAPATMPS
jgi:hypothetical protein